MIPRTNTLLALLVLLSMPLSACASLTGEPLEGQVLEEGTNKPIPNAIVVVLWQGTVTKFVDSTGVCVHVESATTDAEGRFRVPGWSKPSTVGFPIFVSALKPRATAHKPGYEAVHKPTPNPLYLKPSAQGTGERLGYLMRVLGTTSCGSQSESEKNLIALRRALYEEATKIARTKEDQRAVEAIRYDLEILELGFEFAEKRHLERVQTK